LYYIDSERYFKEYAYTFLLLYGFYGYCSRKTNEMFVFTEEVNIQYYTTQFGNRIIYAEKSEDGFSFNEPIWLKKYYTKELDEEQLFALIFGAWCGLDEFLCRIISNKNYKNICWDILYCGVCNAPGWDIITILKSNHNIKEKSRSLIELGDSYKDNKYYIIFENMIVCAIKDKTTGEIITEDNTVYHLI